ncbi:CBL-interacting serine/threonine-protein kinase 14-like isoform X2 [Gastrolobium bilobum]|uniref:CBL-interacting serine/threonine-protein kinase 14-like isoform X2 n=1 Tax=Gastrolobium bilobum TaxID=150636 RepID=UPI002AAF3782|nr:CBL-interacting serine/threonine-protein kinase 14-like isoform X2 [Gastrolobium bilobum]
MDKIESVTYSAGVVLFGKYEIVKLLGVGGFAKVYHARNVNTMESVAVKAVSKRKVQKNGYMAHVEREVSIMRRLRHPHTVELFEVLATKTKIYFVMEFASGGDLFGVMAAEGRFTEDLSRRYFRQLISAVKHCHSRGVFHRDLKLDNILVDENKNIKVSDFGLGSIKDPTRPEGLLHTVCGTPAYVAPEILARKGYDGATVDVWSCGVVLFVLTAGYLPFNDYNITVLYRKIYRGQFRFPKWTSNELRNLLSRLLDTNPNTRITVDEIMRDPWFCHGGYKDTWVGSDPEREKNYQAVTKRLNAFDLISFSSGLDMSGLFTDPEHSDCTERFVTEKLPQKVVEMVEEVAEMERLVRVIKGGESGCGGVRLEGLNGNFGIVVRVYRLTDELYVIEVKRSERGVAIGERFWRDALKPRLLALALKPDVPVSR